MVQSTSKRKEFKTMFTTAEANAILTERFRDTNRDVYIGFSSTTPTETDGTLTNFTEPVIGNATGYFRGELYTDNKKVLEAPSNRQLQNNDVCVISLLRQNLGTMTHFGLFRSGTTTTPFFYGPLTQPVEFTKDHIPVVDIGGFVVGLDKAQLDEAKTWEDYL
jgi:hypothetical protein